MRKALLVALLAGAIAMPAFAADNTGAPNSPKPNFDQMKADVLQRIDRRISLNQEEKACVQLATSQEGIEACRQKIKAKIQEERSRGRK